MKIFNQTLLFYEFIVFILIFSNLITFGRGLGDWFFVIGFIVMMLVHLLFTWLMKRYNLNPKLYFLAIIFLILNVHFTYQFTLGRGSEYPWNGSIFYQNNAF